MISRLFQKFKEKIIVQEDIKPEDEDAPIDNLIALGVLLWVVADADDKFLPQEKDKIKEILHKYEKISDHDMPIVMRAIHEAAIDRIDLYSFTKEVSENLSHADRTEIIAQLFRVACSDDDLDHEEHEMIRKISGLFQLEHSDFIDAKLKVKKEFGMDTAGL